MVVHLNAHSVERCDFPLTVISGCGEMKMLTSDPRYDTLRRAAESADP
jgi:hypothetical protein